MKNDNACIFNLPGYKIISEYTDRYKLKYEVQVSSKEAKCTKCNSVSKTIYDIHERDIKHTFWAERACTLIVFQRTFKCHHCGRRFRESLPGIIPYGRRTEKFKEQIAKDALNGHDNKKVAKTFNVGQATVQRDIDRYTHLELQKKKSKLCPVILGIDEHHFTKKKGYATTIADLKKNKVFDITLGRSDLALDSYFKTLENKERTKLVVMDLSVTYRAIVKKHFPNALIVADRFHVIKLLNLRFTEVWKILEPSGSKSKGLVSLFRRKPENLKPEQRKNLDKYLNQYPALKEAYKFRNKIHKLLMHKSVPKSKMKRFVKQFLKVIQKLENSKLKPLASLAQTFKSWQEEILRMLRFSSKVSNGITEGFHNKMENISRNAYGFRNFKNYKNRVLLKCG